MLNYQRKCDIIFMTKYCEGFNMAGLKIFISSTCYDLSILRSDLRTFVSSMGYEPIMSDYADVVYDPRQHTHSSCIDEVKNCDMLIVVIGSRYGGKGVPEALEKIDMTAVGDLMQYLKANKLQPSITQLEVLEALQNNIPIYTFIDKKVYYEHEVYEKNKDSGNTIFYPAIDRQEIARYIFEFINFLRLRSAGNSIFQFEKMQDIEDALKKQWSGYFQRLLNEQKHLAAEQKRVDSLTEQFKDLKAALLSSIEDVDQRKIAKGIVNYRRMLEMMLSLDIPKHAIMTSKSEFRDLLCQHDIVDMVDGREVFADRPMYPRTFFIKSDHTFFESRLRYEVIQDILSDWEMYKRESNKVKDIVYDTIFEMYSPRMSDFRYRPEPFDGYIDRNCERRPYIHSNDE